MRIFFCGEKIAPTFKRYLYTIESINLPDRKAEKGKFCQEGKEKGLNGEKRERKDKRKLECKIKRNRYTYVDMFGI
jgi:hypothetical protein